MVSGRHGDDETRYFCTGVHVDMSWLSKFSAQKYIKPVAQAVEIKRADTIHLKDYLALGYKNHPDWQLVYNYFLEQRYLQQEQMIGSPRNRFYAYHHSNIMAESENEAKQLIYGELRYKRLHEVYDEWFS